MHEESVLQAFAKEITICDILGREIMSEPERLTLRAALMCQMKTVVGIRTMKMRKKELIERDAEELMQEAASDELFLADLNETMEDFGHADQEDHDFSQWTVWLDTTLILFIGLILK